ncbi:fumarylacetoacetate hydrolase family protein [Propionicicella superfundia]|uniref:fumarylacetoacetate hydrolase family protein n=1 Tax=Propionicicella superfundia TaxID=348582 RepID=UPI0004060037|nr:fumarylacetoacetate hydrolase family protein [Propionicicella superfundia]
MRVARYAAAGADPAFGLVELADDHGEHPDTIARLTGDPLAGPVELTGERVLLSDVRLVAPVLPRSKIIGVGKNYADHIAEMRTPAPEGILTFFKPNTSVIGPEDAIVHPAASSEVSYEGELAVVIGRICKQVPIERVREVIFGYTVANDVTARDWQRGDGQWTRAKGADTFCPLGPWIATHLTIEEASDLALTTTVDGSLRQDGVTSRMIHGIAELVAFCSSFATLLPGDVILTGTPAGVGTVTPGQRVEVTIDRIGSLSNPVIAEEG